MLQAHLKNGDDRGQVLIDVLVRLVHEEEVFVECRRRLQASQSIVCKRVLQVSNKYFRQPLNTGIARAKVGEQVALRAVNLFSQLIVISRVKLTAEEQTDVTKNGPQLHCKMQTYLISTRDEL